MNHCFDSAQKWNWTIASKCFSGKYFGSRSIKELKSSVPDFHDLVPNFRRVPPIDKCEYSEINLQANSYFFPEIALSSAHFHLGISRIHSIRQSDPVYCEGKDGPFEFELKNDSLDFHTGNDIEEDELLRRGETKSYCK